jgi:hypothetical protein
MKVITELQCWGTIPYWVALCKADAIFFEKQERFQKSGNRNRYHILSASGPLLLSVPIRGGRENRQLIDEIKIDMNQSWQKKHLRSLDSCYNKSPFYYYFADEIKELYETCGDSLFDWNVRLSLWILSKIGQPKKNIYFTTTYQTLYEQDYSDRRNLFKTNYPALENYIQVYGLGFSPKVSILDVLFNLGNETFHYLRRQRVV